MASVDQRIVQMVFDNAKFEAAVKVTMNTLDNLKKNLKLDSASTAFSKLDKAAKSVDFSSLEADVAQVADRFSTLGVIGMSVLQNLTTSAMNAGKSLVNALVSPLIEGGKRRALNIEQAKFQIEGLGYAWEDVAGDINYAVDGTAYGLDVAAKAAGQLLASNVAVGDSMKTSLRAISGVAAMTGREYEDISRIFTTVAGNGRLMGDQLLQLSSSGINAAATLGKYLGKSEAEIREMTSKGQIDFATFAAAMDDAFGEHSKEANKTFTGSLSNMKAALARIGAEFATPAYQNLIDINNALKNSFNALKTALAPVIASASEAMGIVKNFVVSLLPQSEEQTKALAETLSGPLAKANEVLVAISKSVWNLFLAATKVLGPIFTAFKDALGMTLLDILINAAQTLESFTAHLIMSDRMTENLRKTFTGIFTILGAVLNIISKVVFAISGTFLNVIARVFGFFADILLRVTGFLGDVVVSIKNFVENILQLEVVQGIIGTISRIFEKLKNILSTVGGFLHELAYSFLDTAFNIALGIFNGIASALEFIATILNNVIMAVKNWIIALSELPAVQKVLDKVHTVLSMIRNNSSELVSIIKSRLSSAFQTARNTITKFISTVKELISQYIELPTLQEVVTKFQEGAVQVFEKSVEIFQKVAEFVGKVIEKVRELASGSIQDVIANFAQLRDRIVEAIDITSRIQTVKNIFEAVKSYLMGFISGTGTVIDGVKNNLLEFVNWIKTKFSAVTLGQIIAGGVGATGIAFFIQLTRLLGSFKKVSDSAVGMIESITKLPKSISGFFKEMSATLKAKRQQGILDAIQGIIKSVALLAAALAILASMDQGAVISAAITLGVLTGALVAMTIGLTKAMSKLNPASMASTIATMITISGSLIILSLSLKILASIDMNNIAAGMLALTIVLAELVGAVALLSKISKTKIKDIGYILFIAGALLILVHSLKALSSMNPSQMLVGLYALTTLMIEMTVFMAAAFLAGKRAGKALKSIAQIGAALLLISISLRLLGSMDPKQLMIGLSAFSAIMSEIDLLMVVSYFAGKHADKAGAAILMISAALSLIAIAIKQIAAISPSDIAKGLLVISNIVILFGLFTFMTKYAGNNAAKAGVAILAMSAGLLAIAGAMAILSTIDPGGLARATVAIDSVIAMFAILVAATANSKDATNSIKYMTLAIVALAGAMAVLSLLNPVNLGVAAAAIDSIIVCFALLISAQPMSVKAMGSVGLMLIAVGALAGLLAGLAQLDAGNVAAAGGALTELLLTLTIMTAVLTAIGLLGPLALEGAFFGTTALVIVFTELTAAFALIGAAANNIAGMKESLQTAVEVLGLIGEAIGSFFGNIAGGFLSGASSGLADLGTNLSSFIKNLQPFFEGVRNIDSSTMSSVQNMVDMVATIAQSDFLNRITELLGGNSGSSIDTLAEGLPKFADTLVEFGDKIGNTNLGALETGANAAKTLAEMANNIPREGGIFDIFGKVDMEGFGTGLESFGGSLVKFGSTVENLNADAINASIGPAQDLVAVANSLEASGGLIQKFAGEKRLDDFGTNLESFGSSLVKYGTSVDGLNIGAINASIEPAQALINLGNSMEALGGLITAFTGEKSLSTFGDNLSGFGKGLASYSDEAKKINADAILASIPAAQGLVDVSNSLQGSGGVIEWWTTGEHNFGTFGNQLKLFGASLKSFSDSLTADGGVDPGKIQEVIPAIQALVDISNVVAAGEFKDFYVKANNFQLGANHLAIALSEFQAKIAEGGVNTSSISVASEALKSIIDIAVQIDSFEGSFKDSGEDLKSFGSSYADFASSMSEAQINVDNISSAIDIISSLGESLSGIGENVVTAMNTIKDTFVSLSQLTLDEFTNTFTTGMDSATQAISVFAEGVVTKISASFEKAKGKMKEAATDIINGIGEGLSDFSAINIKINSVLTSARQNMATQAGSFRELGVTLVNSLAGGFQSGSSRVTSTVSSIMKSAISTATSSATLFRNVGIKMVDAIVSGINASKSRITSAINSIAVSASSGISTSGFYTLGQNCIDGFTRGMQSRAGSARAAAVQVGVDVASALAGALQINSPSKVTMKTGEGFVEGFVKGIGNMGTSAYRAVTNLASEAVSRTEAVLQAIDDTIENQMDFYPTITPVLDTSMIQNTNLGSFSSTFGYSGIGAAVSGIQSISDNKIDRLIRTLEENQNGSDSQVTNVYVDGAIINDDPAIRAVTKNFLVELARKGGM